MKAVGYLLLSLAFFLYYEAFKGRNIPEVRTDLADITRGFVTFNFDAVQDAFIRQGSLSGEIVTGATASVGGNSSGNANGATVLNEAKRLGASAQYRLTGTGPQYYDCSGLIWRAMNNVGYKTLRFSSYTFPVMVPGKTKVSADDIKPGDILQWPGHMAIAENSVTAYNALNVKQGIKSSTIAGLRNALGPFSVYRLNPVTA